MPFITPLELQFVDGEDWILTAPLIYETQDATHRYHVPTGFVTDFASVPRPFWNLFPPAGRHGAAAVVHDFLYRYGVGTKANADRLFREAMEESGVGWCARWIMWSAVRVGGRGSFR